MSAIDFTTAFARLLRDGQLRDAFASDREAILHQWDLSSSDADQLRALQSEDVEFQAQVLLHKRLAAIKPLLPMTCQLLGEQMVSLFLQDSRTRWLSPHDSAASDARAFCLGLRRSTSHTVNPQEWNLLNFVCSKKRIASHVLRRTPTQRRSALQILFRLHPSRWREVILYAQI